LSECRNEDQIDLRQSWRQITIRLDGQIIEIYKDKRMPCYSRIYMPKDTIQDFTLTNNQKDSIFNLVYQIIKHPVVPDHFINASVAETATFSIENLTEVAISTSTSTATTIDYKYIKSWRSLSDKTNELYLILARKIHLLK
jgi:uncharacterized protein (UPF0147 family)